MQELLEIDITEFTATLRTSEVPILLACFASRLFGRQDLQHLIAVQEQSGDELAIHIAAEEDKRLFAKEFKIGGYPVYLLFSQGREQGRFFGSATREDLENFINATLDNPTIKPEKRATRQQEEYPWNPSRT